MQDINIKFKDSPPDITVANIQQILASAGIRVTEFWNHSGVENCWSLNLRADGAPVLASNGKGISKALARASAYGEFIERLQCGLMLYKYQSIIRDPALALESAAPDAKYVTTQELIADGDWMDPIIRTYGGNLTREKIAQQCRVYACTDEDAIRVVPYYSLFEKKYVYLPADFLAQVYASNGCCAGNTREEAWTHALSEILERHNTIRILTSGMPVPKIPDALINQFPVAAKIMADVRANEALDIEFLDFSLGYDFPVVATRIINKASHSYRVNVCADPVLEIAIDRTLTETFQGQQLEKIGASHMPATYDETGNFPMAHNVFNQLENGNGLFGADFFINDGAQQPCTEFTDHSSKTNKELLTHVLSIYRQLQVNIYVRNYSFMGFHTYRVIVPGFSEAKGYDLTAPINEYAMGDRVQAIFRHPAAASTQDLLFLLSFYKRISTLRGKQNNFRQLAGLPMDTHNNTLLTAVTLAYAAYRLEKFGLCVDYLKPLCSLGSLSREAQDFFACVCRFLKLQECQMPEAKAVALLRTFYSPASVDQLLESLQKCGHPFQAYLLQCDTTRCSQCQYRPHCSYAQCRVIYQVVRQQYHAFAEGQKEAVFTLSD